MRVQSHLLRDERHSEVVVKCGTVAAVVLGSCVGAGRELCGASAVALKTFEKFIPVKNVVIFQGG